MPNFSSITIIGHCGHDASVKVLDGGKSVVSWNMAVTRKRKDQETTTWFRCSWFGDRAGKVAEFMTKGKAVCVQGELFTREYEGKDGGTKTSLEVDVRDVVLLGGGERSEAAATRNYADAPAPTPRRHAPAPQDDDQSPPF